MKKEKSQWILQKYKKPLENTMNNCMPTNLTTQKKWNFLDLQPAKTESRRKGSTVHTITRNEIECIIKKHSL